MSKKDALQRMLESLAAPICETQGVELVELRVLAERGASVVRLTIDRERADGKPGSGITIDDCTDVSRALSAILDREETEMPETYRLEVTSPGVERPLVKLADFARFAGREAKIKTTEPVEDKKYFEGRLLGVEGESVKLEASGRTYVIPFEAIAKASLIHRFS